MNNQNTKLSLPSVPSALLGAAVSIAVAFIGIVPQLRQADAKHIEDMRAEIISLKQAISEVKLLSRDGGTSKNQNTDFQAPHIQFGVSQTDKEFSQDQLISKGKEALNRSGFTGIGVNDQVVFGFDKEYTAIVWGVSSSSVMFVVSGPDWQIADKKVQNLRRGF